jgi:UDP-N-acetylmuramate dehydrogenase
MTRPSRPSLRGLNTFGVAASASALLELDRVEQLAGLEFDPASDLLLGGGSNLLLAGDIPGRALRVSLRGRRVLEDDGRSALLEAGAGEPWHELVRWCLGQGLSGIENLSLIPGLAGAAPFQNIGAYGVEIADCLESLSAWEYTMHSLVEFSNDECAFAYRDSHFKSVAPDRYLVTAIRLRLDRGFRPRLDYAGLREELQGVDRPTALQVSDAVVRIRQSKLPDPQVLGNAGSFFKNPQLAEHQASELLTAFPRLPAWASGAGSRKLSAAWMLEHCGWKGRRAGAAGFAPGHALVLVNHGQASGQQLLELAAAAAESVHQRFGLWLEPEPRIVGAPWPHPRAQPVSID